jgi:uncharacterized membrane protein
LVVIAAASSLLAAGIIPPNRWFGLSTPRTLANKAQWYKANRAAGLVLLSAMAAAVAIHYLARFAGQAWVLLNFVTTVALVVAIVAVYRRYAA